MELAVQKREKLGKGVKALREKGLIPAELYGKGIENQHIAVPIKDLRQMMKSAGANAVVNIILDGQRQPALLHDLQRDYITDEIITADFYKIRLDEKIKVKVPVEFVGVAPAVKDLGGVFVKAMQEIEVEALPTNLPQSLTADVTNLKEIGSSLYVKDLLILSGVKLLVEPETVIATVTAQVTEEQEVKETAAVDVAAIKSETEEKKEEREAKKATEAPTTAKAPAGKPAGEKK